MLNQLPAKNEVSRVELSEHSAQITNKVGFIDRSGAFVIQPTFDAVSGFSEGRALLQRDGKYGFIDEDGREHIPATFDFAEAFSDGCALVCVGSRYEGARR